MLPLLLVLGAQLEECGFWSSLSLTHPPSIYQILFESVPSPFLLSHWLSGPMISNLGCFQHLLISLPLVHVAKGCPQEKSNVPWEVQLFRHLDHNCPQGYAQEQASELKMLLTTDSVQGWGMCSVESWRGIKIKASKRARMESSHQPWDPLDSGPEGPGPSKDTT